MPRDLFVNLKGEPRADLDLVWAPYLDRVFTMLDRCKRRNAWYYCQRGTATFEFQDSLHALYLAGTGGRAAPAGESIHNFGGGLDFTADADLIKPGLQPTWDPKAYAILIEEAQRVELVSGASFGDMPHVQIPRYVRGPSMAPMRAIYLATPGQQIDKLRAVWAWLELPENNPFSDSAPLVC